MLKEIQRYVGQTAEIIYQDKDNKFTKRHIRIQTIDGDMIRAFCYAAGGPRVFRIDNVLAVMPPVRRRAI